MTKLTEDEFYALSNEETWAYFYTNVQEAEDKVREALQTLRDLESLFYPVYRDFRAFRDMQMFIAELENALK